jgi:hypothetical protein
MSLEARRIINKWLPGERLQLDYLSLKEIPKMPDFVEELDLSFNSNIIEINSLPSNLKKLTFHGYIAEELDVDLPRLEYLDISYNTIKIIKRLPKTLKTLIMRDSKKLSNLNNIPSTLNILDLSDSYELEIDTFPDNIKHLEIEKCNYIKLPELPSKLEYLNCSRNNLTVIPQLPETLIKLECDHNQIVSLPELPSQLVKIKCSNNRLTSFPMLGDNITAININNNDIKLIRSVPSNLVKLHCRNCNLSILPELPMALKKLHCGDNYLTSLPVLPDKLTELEIEGNPIYKIQTLPISLRVLDISNCRFPSLPDLPAFLQSLICDGISLKERVNLPSNIERLSINNTGIKRLPKLNSKIVYLSCRNNNLTKLPTLPSKIEELDCSHNLLTTLPPLPYSLTNLDCSFNQLKSFPRIISDFNTINVSHNSIESIPDINHIIIDLDISHNQITYLPKITQYIEKLNIAFNNIKSEKTLESLPKTIRNIVFEGNPVYEKIAPSLKNPSIHYNTIPFDKENVNVITLPKGTVLFKGFKSLDASKMLSDYLGWYKPNGEYSYIWPDFNVFYYPYPFVIDDINLIGTDIIMTTNYLRKDIKIILGISPSENARNDRHSSNYLKTCSKVDVSEHFEGLYYDPCLNPEFVEKNPDVVGSLFISGTDAKEHKEITAKNIKYIKYRHFFQDNNNIIGVPEIIIHPFTERHSKELKFGRKKTATYEWLSRNIDKYNYSTLSTDNHKAHSESSFKKMIDALLSPEGAVMDGQVYHMTIDTQTLFFVIAELADKETLKHCIPIKTRNKLVYLN